MRKAAAGLAPMALVLAGTPAWAQNSAAEAPPADGQPADAAAETTGVTDIVVTAQKRSENIQSVPITISAFDGEALASTGVDTAMQLSTLVPGLVFNRSVGSGIPFLRGVGQSAGANGVEPTVAFYLDGVYFPQSGSTVLSLNSVEQIAVLKGPQGTLFGRNSTGGVIQVTTRTPGRTPELIVDVGYANYDTLSTHAYAATPIGNALSTSVAVAAIDQADGWGRNVFLNREIFDSNEVSTQSKSVLDLASSTSLTLNLLYVRTRSDVGTAYGIPPGSLGNDGRTSYISEYEIAAGADTERFARHVMGSLTLDHDFGWASAKAQVATQSFRDRLTIVQNGLPLGSGRAIVIPIVNTGKPTTAEFQLQSPGGDRFRWIVGGFFLASKEFSEYDLKFDTVPRFHQVSEQTSKSYAVFGEVSTEILPETRLTVGGRYTIDRKGLTGTQTTPAGAIITTFERLAAAGGFPTRRTWKEPTYRVSLDHQLTPDILLFGSYNHGFKSGLFNLITLNNRPADPEEIDAFELGTKTLLFDRRLRLNVSGFYYDYKDLQLRTVVPPAADFILYNAAQARIKGIDVDVQAAVTDRFDITGGFEVLDAEYTRFPGAPCTTPLPTGGNATTPCDLSGGRMLRAPKFSGNIGVQYRVPLADGRGLELNVNDLYNSGFNWEASGRTRQDSYHSLSASIRLSFQDGRYFARLWGANLANEKIRAVGGEAASDVYGAGAPRTYGLTIGCNCLR